MATSTEKTCQKLFEAITALTTVLDAVDVQGNFERAAELETLREAIAETREIVPSTWPGAPAVPAGAEKEWPSDPGRQLSLQQKLATLRDKLLEFVANDGPSQPANHIMRRAYASTGEIVVLVLLGLIGTLAVLWSVIERWPNATPQKDDAAETSPRASTSASSSATPASTSASAGPSASSAAPGEGEPPSNDDATSEDEADADAGDSGEAEAIVPGGGRADAGAADAGATDAGAVDGGRAARSKNRKTSKPRAPAANAPTELQRAIARLDAATKELEKKTKPVPERNVLLMIVLLGALGGFVHLTSSLVKYVGTRKLLRSWIVYYLLMPVSGAGLAPMVYLLLRVGVLGNGTGEMNVFGLYAFAAMTGLLAEQALEKLADVFSELFAKPSHKDRIKHGDTKKKGT